MSSSLDVGILHESDIPFSGVERRIAKDDPIYDSFTSTFHPLAHLKGQTGRVSMQLSGYPTGNTWSTVTSVNCRSGLLCADFNRMNGAVSFLSTFDMVSFDIFAWDADPSGEWYLNVHDPIAGTGRIFFTDDRFSGLEQFNGKEYRHDGARAHFSLTNIAVTELPAAPTPVPLPATAWLLGMGLFALGMEARRRAT